MNEIGRIADQLERAVTGEPWYGSSLRVVLEGVDAEGAARRILSQAHTIWEIVLHITAWEREVLRRLHEGVAREPADGDWPPPQDASAAAWASAVERLETAHRDLLRAVRAFPEGRLGETIGDEEDRPLGSGVSYYVMLHGVVQHTLAHTAQISLLRKGLT